MHSFDDAFRNRFCADIPFRENYFNVDGAVFPSIGRYNASWIDVDHESGALWEDGNFMVVNPDKESPIAYIGIVFDSYRAYRHPEWVGYKPQSYLSMTVYPRDTTALQEKMTPFWDKLRKDIPSAAALQQTTLIQHPRNRTLETWRLFLRRVFGPTDLPDWGATVLELSCDKTSPAALQELFISETLSAKPHIRDGFEKVFEPLLKKPSPASAPLREHFPLLRLFQEIQAC